MNRLTAAFYLAAAMLPTVAAAAPKGACATGTLLDVQVDTRMIPGGTPEHGQVKVRKDGKREYNGYSTTYPQKQTTYTVTVRLDDRIYTGEAQEFFGFGFKPTSLVINDPVQGCLRGNTLALGRPDGKEYKTRLLRTERVPR